MNEPAIDLSAIKARQRATWAEGNYAIVGTTLQIVGERLCESVDLRAGSRVLDVAAGNGNATLAAARRFADVTSTDYVGSLLDAGRRRAEAEGLAVRFQEADAENLPFESGAFDVVLSTFGVMFAPDQQKAAHELIRVCRRGGRIGLANWTPEGFIGALFRTLAKHVPPPPGLKSPALWGSRSRIEELFGHAGSIETVKRHFNFRYRSAPHFIEVFRTWYGPVNRAFAALERDPARVAALTDDLVTLLEHGNHSGDDDLVVPGEYLEVVVRRI